MKVSLRILLLLTLFDASVLAATSRRIHLRGKGAKSIEELELQDKTAPALEEMCREIELDINGTRWNLTDFTWDSSLYGAGEETLKPVNLTLERRGMTMLVEENGISGTCGNNLCWGVMEKIGYKLVWIHDVARTRMMSTPQEDAYVAMLMSGPYTYITCEESTTASNATKLHFFEVDIDDDGNLIRGRLMAIYDQIDLAVI